MRYDAGLLNDFGGGDVNWWQDYLRAELERSHDFYTDRIEFLEAENAALQQQIDGLQQRVHLCAGYDALEKENDALREALQSIVDCTPANKHEVWPHHHHYLVTARNALAPPTTDKESA